LPLAFTACAPDSFWCKIAFVLTSSGGPKGFLALLVLTGYFYSSSQLNLKAKLNVFFVSIVSLLVFFGSLAWINEYYTKPILKLQRPSHVYMLDKIGDLKKIDAVYQLSIKEREVFFEKLIAANPVHFQNIDVDIQNHWIEEAGFSFPSGHTFNAFLFAMLIAYAIYYNRSRPALRKLYFLPFVWALFVGISRVSMGAHSALDVSCGATLGIVIGYIFLRIDFTRLMLTRK